MNNKQFRIVAIGIFVALTLGAIYTSFSLARGFAANNPFGNDPFDPKVTPDEVDPSGENPTAAVPTENPNKPFDYSIFGKWEGSDRVNILIMGLDYRDWAAGEGAPRTDTMMILTIDPLSKTAGMLSIPRDLWVPIPGFTYDRINTAYRNGVTYEYPGGGPALAAKTVEQLLGIPIHYYAQIDFEVFVRLVDEIGGVKIDIEEAIIVDVIGDKPPKTLEPGRQTLPGDVALAYARARNSEGGDFDRAKRQQQVILGLREQVLQWDLLPKLLPRAGIIYNDLNKGVQTNLTLEEAIQLALLAFEIPLDEIKKGIIGGQDTIPYTTIDGDKVLKPIPDKIHTLRAFIFGTTAQASPLANLSVQERIAAENANIMIMNGTFVDGLGIRTIDYLNSLGGFAIPPENRAGAEEGYVFTTIIDFTGNPYTFEFLVETFKVQSNRILIRYDPNSTVDIMIYLGSDWAGTNPMP